MSEYRVNLDSYNGPLDLLLYLIRRDEVDIYDIPIAAVTEQYLKYVDLLKELDPNLAGEFLVMAATLIEIKTRTLLPSPPAEEGPDQGVGLDPRAELVRQLLEYKAFKDAAGDLADAADAQALKFPRKPAACQADPTELDLENVQVWDLLDAFSRLMAAIGRQAAQHEVVYDDTPQELHQADILDRLKRDGHMTFSRLFEGRIGRGEMVGLFLALLELVRQKRVAAIQESPFAEIHVHLRPEADALTPAEAAAGQPEQAPPEAQGGESSESAAANVSPPDTGQYVSDRDGDRLSGQEYDNEPDDGDTEAQGTGA